MIRAKAPLTGTTVIRDVVQGDVTIANEQLDDMIVLRSDGTPTYMLAVVVDDHDMGVTHVIRGDDHLNNAARQMLVYAAMGWEVPVWAHIPLIHGEDGKKLSKRHGAQGVEDWARAGYPAPAMRNYLARLGWSHGDDEFFTDKQAWDWFDIAGIKRAAARFDTKKLENLSRRHFQTMPDAEILDGMDAWLGFAGKPLLTAPERAALAAALPAVRGRAKTYPELLEQARFALAARPVRPDDKAAAALDPEGRQLVRELTLHLRNGSWNRDELEAILTSAAETRGLSFGKLAAPLRAALAGRTTSPSVYDMMLVLGQAETVARLEDVAA